MKKHLIFAITFLALIACDKRKELTTDTLADTLYGFENVQDSARTKTWWFHSETETTKDGITADLEAYKKEGIGGVVYYDQTHGRAENALPAFSPEWWQMLRFSAEEAERVGLSFEVNVSNGFVAGGPWITNEYSMKRLTATELLVQGGQRFEGKLEVPMNKHNYSKDVAVLAFPAPEGKGSSSLTASPRITSNIKELDAEEIFNSNSQSLTWISVPEDERPVYLNLAFDSAFSARSICYEVRPKGLATTSATNIPAPPQETFVGTGYRLLPNLGQLEVSDDGVNYKFVCDLKPIYRAHENWQQKTISFPVAKGKYFRLNLHDWWESNESRPNMRNMQLGKVVISSAAKVDQWEEKAALYSEYIEQDRTPEYQPDETVKVADILNITDKMDADGVLRWDVPPGDWIVMRFAYVPTGGSTKHGRKNLMGRECDKMSVAAAKLQWDNYVGRIIDSLKVTNSGRLVGVVMDSHEAGAQNWTDNFIEEFKQRRGYDPTLYLPAMMGYVVDDWQRANGFLFDVRRNIADMIADNYYGTFERLSKENNLILTAQATGNALCIVSDPIQAKSKVTKPQGEFWPIHPDGNYDIKESSSSAHLYDKYVASAEAYTDAKYSHSPADLKTLADYAYAFGINEFVICASAYQPWLDRYPGSTGGGRHYCINRNNTWWEYSAPFWDYQARCAYVMRKGKSSNDLCVFLGENAPVKILTYRLPDIPGGFDFDAFTADALHSRMEANDGLVTLPDGVNYKMMVLPRNGDITLEALIKIGKMVDQGIKVYGPKPSCSKSGKEMNRAAEYATLANELWGESPADQGQNQYGKGTVYWGMTLAEALKQADIHPDISMQEGNTKDAKIYFAHRKLADGDVYFMANRKDAVEDNIFTFSAEGKYAEMWNPVSGKRYALEATADKDGGATVKLRFAPRESYFVVVTNNKNEQLPVMEWQGEPHRIEQINSSWSVHFDPKWGGAGDVIFDRLTDWTSHTDKRIKYYSGTAIYKKNITVDSVGGKVYLDLGNPQFVARVFVNDREAGIVWCSPWRLNIAPYLKEGENKLEIRVANSLINRMIYDESLPEKERVTYSYPTIVSANDELVPSGLLNVELVWE